MSRQATIVFDRCGKKMRVDGDGVSDATECKIDYEDFDICPACAAYLKKCMRELEK